MTYYLSESVDLPDDYRRLIDAGLWPNYGHLQRTTKASAGTDTVISVADTLCGALILTAGASGDYTITLPATSSIISGLGKCKKDGTYSMWLTIKNDDTGHTGTVTAADEATVVAGTATIATNTTRTFLLTVASATTLSVESFGLLATV